MSEGRLLRHLGYAISLLLPLGGCSPAASTPPVTPPVAVSPSPSITGDPYHPPPSDTVEVTVYKGWQQYSLHCARCHGEEGHGTSFAPSLILSLKPDGDTPTRDDFLRVLVQGRPGKGMPSAAKIGIDSVYFDGLYDYLKGRSDGRLHGGRPARRDN